VFQLDAAEAKAKSVFVKKTKPGLSSYAENPAAAAPPLLKLLIEGAQSVPEEVRGKMSLSILATAGMRMLAPARQQAVWDAVKAGLLTADYPFSPSQLEAKTVSGEDEGFWALYNANFLTGRMSHDLLSHGLSNAKPLGLMDLGGSSTQIVIPGASAAQEGAMFGNGVLSHSYLGFGMTHIREQVRKAAGSHDSVCYMKGQIDGDRTGDAHSCRDLLRDMVKKRSSDCQASADVEKPCLGDLAGEPDAVRAIQGTVDFYAVAGMTYVVDFIRWWLEFNPTAAAIAGSFLKAYPKPSIEEITVAADALCAGDYKFVADRTANKELRHAFTGFDNAPYRCFQANYILVLLEDMYGFRTDGRSITFLLDVDGEDLEWPLGALLHRRAQGSGKKEL